jgi:GNAT superfamily N-acetyltransferase
MQGRLDLFGLNAVYSPLPNAEFQEGQDSVFYAWGINYAIGNGILEKDQNRIPTDREIERAIAFFSAKKLPFIWWTAAKVLETKGFQFGGALTGIALEISQGIPVKPETSKNLIIKMVQSEAEMAIFAKLSADICGIDPNAIEQWRVVNASALAQGKQVHFLAYWDATPIGTVTLASGDFTAGIWALATLPEYRKHGVATALVHAALSEAKKRHHNQVMAILMPKGLAWGLFTKLGFKKVCNFDFYVYGATADELEK